MAETLITRIANRPGELAKITTMLGDANVNVTGLFVNAHGEQGTVSLLCDDIESARKTLHTKGIEAETRTVYAKRIKNKPGALAAFTRELADAGINIRQALGTTTRRGRDAEVWFEVEDPEKAARFFQ